MHTFIVPPSTMPPPNGYALVRKKKKSSIYKGTGTYMNPHIDISQKIFAFGIVKRPNGLILANNWQMADLAR